jgi:CheY-like chemotaxis protein
MLCATLNVESFPGEGSLFVIRLPMREPRASMPYLISPEMPEVPSKGELGTVLVIDDDPLVRDLMGRLLTSEGFGVITAADGQEGLERARKERPAAITLDVLMPKLDGWSLLGALQADPELSRIPVVIVSVVDQRGMGIALGARAFVPKPIERERLVSALMRYVRPPGSVLVVDDDLACLDLVRRTLVEQGLDVHCVASGEAALLQLQETRPDLVLLDLMMPGLDGFNIVEAMHQDPALRSIPILVMTAKELSAGERSRLSGRVEQILAKDAGRPVNLVQWVSRIASKRIQRTAVS